MQHLAGFLHDACPYSLLCSVYSGHHTYLISPYDLDVNPSLWLSVVSSNKGMSAPPPRKLVHSLESCNRLHILDWI